MRKLKLTKINPKNLYRNILRNKDAARRSTLASLEAEIFNCYSGHDLLQDNLWLYFPSLQYGNTEYEALENAYNASSTPMSEARVKIFRRLKGKIDCPYCGLGNATESIDHFLPFARFPEFAVFPSNLVPVCPRCNKKKGFKSHITGNLMGNPPQFFNPYFDKLPKTQFLFCQITRNPFGAKFRLEKPTSWTEDEFQHIVNHFQNLKLLEEYELHSRNVVKGFFDEYKDVRGVSNLAKTSFLKSRIKSNKKNHGLNYFKTVIYLEMLSSNFISSIP